MLLRIVCLKMPLIDKTTDKVEYICILPFQTVYCLAFKMAIMSLQAV